MNALQRITQSIQNTWRSGRNGKLAVGDDARAPGQIIFASNNVTSLEHSVSPFGARVCCENAGVGLRV